LVLEATRKFMAMNSARDDVRQEQGDDGQHDVDADHHQRLAPHAQDEQVDEAEEEREEVDVDLQAVAGQRLPGLLETGSWARRAAGRS
jgi:predicted  nucleic acid-binding Zn-ribbon protein